MSKNNSLKSHSLQELSDPQLHCRIYGHPWNDAQIVKDKIGVLKVFRQVNTCESCGLIRADILDMDGEVWSRRYNYSKTPGYQLSFAVSTPELRQERCRREASGTYDRRSS